MDKIYQKKILPTLSDKLYLYKPTPKLIKGEVDSEEYYVEVVEGALPTGVKAAAPTNVSSLSWDDSYYVSWDKSVGPVDKYKIEVYDGASLVVSAEIDPTKTSYLFEDNTNDYITNGTTYTIKVGATLGDATTYAADITTTPSNRVPTVTIVGHSDTSLTATWNTVTNADSYIVHVYDSGTEVKTISGVTSTSITVTGLTKNVQYDITVEAISDLFGSSGESTSATGTTILCDLSINSISSKIYLKSHLLFNGTDQYADLGQLNNFWQYLHSGTFEFMIKTSVTAKISMGFIDGVGFTTSFQMVLNDKQSGQFSFRLFTDSSSINYFGTTNATNLFDGNPHRLSVVLANSNTKIYIDGVSEPVSFYNLSPIQAGDTAAFDKGWTLGAMHHEDGSLDNYVNAEFDDLRFWSSERTQTEIQDVMNSPLTAPNGWATDYPNLLTYYKFDEGQENNIKELVTGINYSLVNNVNDNMWVEDNL